MLKIKNFGKILFLITLLLNNKVVFASDAEEPLELKWKFDGFLGYVDKQSAQRGFQVYKEVCSACHSLSLLSYRNLKDLGFSESEVKELASSYMVKDEPNDAGEVLERPARPSDRFASPYPNENAARAANNGAYPPDLSVIIKARHDGANYLHSLLNGYGDTPPADIHIADGMYYNPYFPGKQIAMPAPLTNGQVSYADGTESSVEQMSRDVVNFLQWAAEPEMERRKKMGLKVIIYLALFTAVFMVAKRNIWSKLRD